MRGNFFSESTTPPDMEEISVTRMLTRDLFAVVNFLVKPRLKNAEKSTFMEER